MSTKDARFSMRHSPHVLSPSPVFLPCSDSLPLAPPTQLQWWERVKPQDFKSSCVRIASSFLPLPPASACLWRCWLGGQRNAHAMNVRICRLGYGRGYPHPGNNGAVIAASSDHSGVVPFCSAAAGGAPSLFPHPILLHSDAHSRICNSLQRKLLNCSQQGQSRLQGICLLLVVGCLAFLV